MVRFIKIITVSLLLATVALGQTPEAVVREYWSVLQSSDWAKCARLVHPASLKRVRENSDSMVVTISGLGESILINYFEVTSKADYDKLSDAVVFERLLGYMAKLPGRKEILRATKFRTLGTVAESDDLFHVLYRSDVEMFDSQGNRLKVAKFEKRNELVGLSTEINLPVPDGRASVISLRRDGGEWRVLADDEVANTIDDLDKMMKEFEGHMKTFAESLSKQQKAKSKKKPRPKR